MMKLLLDFAFDLATSDVYAAPSIDQITINYNEGGDYVIALTNDYLVEDINFTQTRVTKLSAGEEVSVKFVVTIN